MHSTALPASMQTERLKFMDKAIKSSETTGNQPAPKDIRAQFKEFDQEITQKRKKQEQMKTMKSPLQEQFNKMKEACLAQPANPESAFLNKPYSAEELAKLSPYIQKLAQMNPIEARRSELEAMKESNPMFLKEILGLSQTPKALEKQEAPEKPKKIKPIAKKHPEEEKEFKEYVQSKPEEIKQFEIKEDELQDYSNTADFYDMVPKYFWGNQKRDKKGRQEIDVLERTFMYHGEEYVVIVQPAKIKGQDGKYKEYYASTREELVEDALRKLACEGKSLYLDDSASVTFTLYEIQKELQRVGYGYNINEIKESLMIMAKSILEIRKKDGSNIIIMPFFYALGLQTKKDWKKHGNSEKAYVCFNPLVTQSIEEKTYRTIDYIGSMSYKLAIARWFHKRLSNNYIQASKTDPYAIKLSTILRDSGMKQYPHLRDNIRQLKEALEEMIEKEVLSSYKADLILEERKIVDAKFTLIPHDSFIGKVKLANKRAKEIKAKETKQIQKPKNNE